MGEYLARKDVLLLNIMCGMWVFIWMYGSSSARARRSGIEQFQGVWHQFRFGDKTMFNICLLADFDFWSLSLFKVEINSVPLFLAH